jgi:sulfur relay (sulfurtransferase) complex TusBCD TusD component (DsrE family)
MEKTFGICAATRNHMTHVLGLAQAAKKQGIHVEIFLSGEGIHLTQDPRFSSLLETGRVGVCEVSYLAAGFKKEDLAGLVDKDFVTQLRNADMVDNCDRYLIL